jgi:ABC transporter substrate binding protein (PQQ-dependent alcohol dehydrogenase system)
MRKNITIQKFLPILCGLMLAFAVHVQADVTDIKAALLIEKKPIPPALSNLDPVLTDEGVQGAKLGIKDNNTTGQFTGHSYTLAIAEVPVGDNVREAFNQLVSKGYRYVITSVNTETLISLSALAAEKGVLLFNIASADGTLRTTECGANTFHMLPSYEMKADALAQFMLKKRWKKWFLVKGSDANDVLFAKAIKRSAKRFGVKVVEEKTWTFDHDARRTAQADIPVFTQGDDYDVLVVADVKGLFGEYLPMNTWLPRPVAGTQGMAPRAWHRTHERWGAVQMQNRFYEQAGRWMTDIDYSAWLAVRSIGEAVTRAKSPDVKTIKSFLLSDEFSVAGFKGTKLTFRSWNHQLRQPVLLATPRSIVSVMPQKEFLHPRTYLDTLGYDKPESNCHL